jgi:phytanoyl-CoA dioxygenase PhyH
MVDRDTLEAHPDIVFDARHDFPGTIAESMRRHGIAYIKNVIDRDAAAFFARSVAVNARALKDMIGRDVNDMPLCFADREIRGSEKYPALRDNNLAGFKDPLTFSGMDRSWYYEGERNYKLWFWRHGNRFPNRLLRAVLDSVLPRVYTSYFGGECFTSYEADTVRYQRPDIRHLSYFFHQDGNYHSRDPRDHVGITTWVPLVDAGKEAPGLQFYPKKFHELLPLPVGIDPPYLFADEAYCLDRFGDTLWAPLIPAGDVVIFDSFCVHRTFITTAMTRERQSADVRVFPVRGAPKFARRWKSWSLTFADSG